MKAAATTMPMNRQQRRRARAQTAKNGAKTPASSVGELHSQGLVLLRDGDLAAAERVFRKVLAIEPKDLAAHLALGEIAKRVGASADAFAFFKAAVEIDGASLEAWKKFGAYLFESGNHDAAAVAFARAVALDPRDAQLRVVQGVNLYNQDQYEAARAALEAAIALKPDYAFAHFELGKLLQTEGDFDAAMGCYQTALDHDPGFIDVHFRAVAMNRCIGEPEDVLKSMAAVAASVSEPDERRSLAHFTAGRLHHRAGNYDASFQEFARGNEIRARNNPYRRDLFHSLAAENIEAFTAQTMEAMEGRGHDSELPVLVVGMPRSGTTLVEKVIAAHTRAAGAGELDRIGEIHGSLRKVTDGKLSYPRDIALIESDQLCALAEHYLTALAPYRDAETARVVDKMPANLFHIGLIACLFPNARFVHCCRHPLDVALSCSTQYFSQHHALAFANDLDAFADYYALQEKLMAHWKEVLPGRILDVSYENMTAAQEETSRRLIDHIGLDWEDGCLEFHTKTNSVRTASVWQVRQPIYRSSVAKWRKYETHLAPLKAKLEELGVEVPD